MKRFTRIAPVLMLLLGIFATCSPDFATGIPCKNDYECPTGYACDNQKCVSSGPGEGGGGGGGGGTSSVGFKAEPSSIDFGGVQVKDQKVMTVKVTNVAKANAPIQVKGTVKTGGDVFKSLTDEYVSVPAKSANGMVDVQIAYKPTKIKSDNGVLVISSNEPGNPTREITLKGNGTSPDLEVTPGTLDFGTQFKGAPVPVQKVTVKNAGEGTLTLTGITVNTNPSSQYSMINVPTMPKSLETNSSMTFDVQFKPTIPGAANGSILIKSEDIDEPEAVVTLKADVQDACPAGKFDVNGEPADGCECLQVKTGGKNCVEAVDLGPIPDTGAVVKKEGNLVPDVDEDWYTFTATDDEAADVSLLCDKFHVRALFSQGKNPDNLAMDLFQGCGPDKRESCASTCFDPATGVNKAWADTNRLCEASQDKIVFAVDYNEPGDAQNPPKGECPCTQKSDTTGTAGQNWCVDDTQRFYVRVYRVNTSAFTCSKYEIEISNGFYKYADP